MQMHHSGDKSQDPTEDAGASNWTLIKRLLGFSWQFRGDCVLVLTLQVVLLALGLLGLNFTGLGLDVIGHGIDPSSAPPRWTWGIAPPSGTEPLEAIAVIASALLALAIFRAVLNYGYSISIARLVQEKIIVALRAEVFEKLQRLSFRFYDQNASGSIINRVTGDVQGLRLFVDGVLIQVVIMALSLTVYFVYMLNIHVGLTIACLATTPLLWVSSLVFSNRVKPAYVRNRKLFDRMVLTLSECVQGIQVVKGFGRQREETAKFEAATAAVCDQQQNIFWNISLFSPAVGFLTRVNLIVLLAYGGTLTIHGELPLGTGLIVFAGLLQQFSAQVGNVATIANSIQQSLTGARRVFEILDAPVEVASPPTARPLGRASGGVRFEHVDFEFRGIEPVLRNIDFAIQPGQCMALVGPTGSGKSAIMSLVPRFYDPTKGTVRIDGLDLRECDLDDVRRNVGVVFQESFLFSNTVAANIAFGHPDATREQIERAAEIAAADEFIRELPEGYDSLLLERGGNLSGGQRQRLAIARAILLEPPILLLDDPTSAIDPATEKEILGSLERVMRGRTTIVAASRMSTLRRADLILVLDRGRIVQKGSLEELSAVPGRFQTLVRLELVDDVNIRESLLKDFSR